MRVAAALLLAVLILGAGVALWRYQQRLPQLVDWCGRQYRLSQGDGRGGDELSRVQPLPPFPTAQEAGPVYPYREVESVPGGGVLYARLAPGETGCPERTQVNVRVLHEGRFHDYDMLGGP